jgi:hypothetical protein
LRRLEFERGVAEAETGAEGRKTTLATAGGEMTALFVAGGDGRNNSDEPSKGKEKVAALRERLRRFQLSDYDRWFRRQPEFLELDNKLTSRAYSAHHPKLLRLRRGVPREVGPKSSFIQTQVS